MSRRRYPALTCAEVKAILKSLEFEPRAQNGTSHQHWIKDVNGRRYKVTVDCPKAPFSVILIQSMINQSGVGRVAFYKATKKTAKKI